MENASGQRPLSRAERFLVDDERHLRIFEGFRKAQERNLAELNAFNSGVKMDTAEIGRVLAEQRQLSEALKQIMAENARLLAEEKKILYPGLLSRLARLFKKFDKAELDAIALIRRNALMRKQKSREFNQRMSN